MNRPKLLPTMAVLLAVLLGSCSGDEPAETSTTSAPDPSAEESTTSTLTDEEFGAVVDDLAPAEADLCTLVETFLSPVEVTPSSPAQVRTAVDAVTGFLAQFAGLDVVDEASSAVLAGAADRLRSDAEAAGYSVEFFVGGDVERLFAEPEVSGAFNAVMQLAAEECGPEVFGPIDTSDAESPTDDGATGD